MTLRIAGLVGLMTTAMALAACQGGDGINTSCHCSFTVDAGVPRPDGGGGDCNPVTQAGCTAGEKCDLLIASDEPFLAGTACVPDGTVGLDEPCEFGEPGPDGYNNCQAGLSCREGLCSEICAIAGGDTCRDSDEAFGEGSYCTHSDDGFGNEIGLCSAACDPTSDNLVGDNVVNSQCGVDSGCYLHLGRGVAACGSVVGGAANKQQNETCHGPAAGACYINGCASGYGPILPDAVGQAITTNNCARYCTPVDTYTASTASATGMNGKCGGVALAMAGSDTQGIAHECRFVQSLYDQPLIPETQGMCAPIDPWSDCGATYEFMAMRDAVLTAADTAAANTAFNDFCYGTQNPPDGADVLPKCDGLAFGCTSIATTAPIFAKLGGTSAAPANTPDARRAWLKTRLAALTAGP